MYVAELFNGGLPPSQLKKRTKWVKDAKDKRTICRYPGCITPVSGYHRDSNGNQETLCRRHYSEVNEPSPRASAARLTQLETARASKKPILFCKKRGHDLQVFGRYASGSCKECDRVDSLERARIKRVEEGRPYEAPKAYKLKNLKALKLEWGGTYEVLVRETGLKEHSLKKWMPGNVGTFMWNIEVLAEFFTRELGRTISTDDLISQSREVAM